MNQSDSPAPADGSEQKSTRRRSSSLNILAELSYPTYRNRHIFTARLRFIIFVAFFVLYALGLSEQIPLTHPAMITVLFMTILTIVSYYNILTAKRMLPSLIFEVVADLVTITIVVDLLGGITSAYYLIYFGYCLCAGLFFNYRVAALLSVLSIFCYSFLYGSTVYGILPWHEPTTVSLLEQNISNTWPHPLWVHPFFLVLLLGFAVYAVKMAQEFHSLRERSLEVRNRELLALQKIGGMIRTTAPLQTVADRVIHGLVEGLDLAGCVLMLVNRRQNRLSCYPARNLPGFHEAEAMLGVRFSELFLPMDDKENFAYRKIKQRKVVFRRDMADLLEGIKPEIPTEKLRKLQEDLHIRKTMVLPLVAEGELIGALVGFFHEHFIGERAVATLETFANQAALVLSVTLLIERLKGANRELLEANRVKSEFLATMSHELRTPLTAIIGFSELLIEGAMGEVNEEQKDSLKEVLNNGSNLLELINNILDLARMESGRFKLNLSLFELGDLLERTKRTLSSLLTRKSHNFYLQIPRPLPAIEADERRVQQILLNLLGNAIKFTPEGGSITVSALHFEHLQSLRDIAWQEQVQNRYAFARGGIWLQVSDTGIGIPTSHLDTIFEMFQQIDSSVTRKYEGTGLGLALVRQLVEMHQGVIWAESEEGSGTTFHCLLPLAYIEEEAETEAETHQGPHNIVPTIRVPV